MNENQEMNNEGIEMPFESTEEETFKNKAIAIGKKIGKIILIGGAGFLLGSLTNNSDNCECEFDEETDEFESDVEESTEV